MEVSIHDFIPYYPHPSDPNFNRKLNEKQEFNDPVVEKIQTFPSNDGDLMAHQTVISRIMSSHTPYNGILLMHEMGTGKSCAAIAILEQLRREKNGIKRFIYVCSNDDLKRNFEVEFKGVCTKGDYENVNISRFQIVTMTYDEFFKKLERPTYFNNSLIIIDEVHNIKTKKTMKGETFDLSSLVNSKVVLMSGTPMTDKPLEIGQIMNIILPENEKLNTEAQFYNEIENPENKKKFIKAITGRISYLKSPNDDSVVKAFKGEKLKGFKKFILSKSVMSEFQKNIYYKALERDEKEESPAYTNSLQASEFTGEQVGQDSAQYGTKYDPGSLRFKSKDNKGKLLELKKYSSKYAASIETILEAVKNGKNIFIFNSFVSGGGIETFSRILQLFNFEKVKYSNINKIKSIKSLGSSAPAGRFVTLTGTKPDKAPIEWKQMVVKRFNQKDNKNGNFINIVIASTAISEGYSFKNIQVVDIQSPWFQFARISQAIARGFRFGSHKDLLEGKNKIEVDVYLRVAVTDDTQYSNDSDIITYNLSEKKDLVVKKIEHIIKENAIDSLINYDRNSRPSKYDDSRECEYTKCEYTPFPGENVYRGVTDYSTSVLYYGVTDEMKGKVLEVFKKHDSVKLEKIISDTNMGLFVLISTLYEIITSDISIIKNGKKFYIREQNDVYYVTDVYTNKVCLLDIYYSDLKQPEKTPDEPESVKQSVFDLEELFSSKDITNTVKFKQYLKSVNAGINEEQKVLEYFITNYDSEISKNSVGSVVAEFFSGLFGEIDSVTYTWHKLSEITPRKKTADGWVDCDQDETKMVRSHTRKLNMYYIQKYNDIKSDKVHSFVGMFDYDSDGKKVFKLLVSTKENTDMLVKSLTTDEKIDNRKLATGKVCTFIPAKSVLSYALEIKDVLDYTEYTSKKNKPSRPELCQYIEEMLKSKDIYTRFIEK